MFLGVDLGTSGLKLAAVSADGHAVAEAEAAYEVQRPAPGFAEIDPEAWMAALHQALPQLGERTWEAVGVAGQMHGLVLVDARGASVRPAILWPDRRADLSHWHALPAPMRQRLANPLTPGMAGPILGWLQEHDPEAVRAARLAFQPKDYVRAQLGGALVGERSDASATLLWNVLTDDWAHDVIDELGLPAQLLPLVVASSHVVGSAQLPGSPTLVAGAGDTPAALLGSGGLQPGQVQVNLGSGAQILTGVESPRPAVEPLTQLYADADSAWYGMVALQNGGLALNRFREWLGFSWDEFFAAAAGESGGVSIMPFLSGERGAVAGPDSRGAWLGLSDTTSRENLARAAVEGMVFAVAQGVRVLAGEPQRIRMTGGGARNPMVPQMLADAVQARIEVVPKRSASALGAAMLAAAGVGVELPPPTDEPVVFEPGSPLPAYDVWRERLPVAAGL